MKRQCPESNIKYEDWLKLKNIPLSVVPHDPRNFTPGGKLITGKQYRDAHVGEATPGMLKYMYFRLKMKYKKLGPTENRWMLKHSSKYRGAKPIGDVVVPSPKVVKNPFESKKKPLSEAKERQRLKGLLDDLEKDFEDAIEHSLDLTDIEWNIKRLERKLAAVGGKAKRRVKKLTRPITEFRAKKLPRQLDDNRNSRFVDFEEAHTADKMDEIKNNIELAQYDLRMVRGASNKKVLEEEVQYWKRMATDLEKHTIENKVIFSEIHDWKAKDRSLSTLRTHKVQRDKALGGGVNESRRVGNSFEGVWKRAKGEKDCHRDGIPVGTYWTREAAGYRVDQAMGLNRVPPTVLRQYKNEWGSLQEYKSNAKLYGERERAMREAVEKAVRNDHTGGAFDFIVGNTDRHGNNLMYKVTDRSAALQGQASGIELINIDNGLCFPARATKEAKDKLRIRSKYLAQQQGEEISDAAHDAIDKLLASEKETRKALKPVLNKDEIDGVFERARILKENEYFPESGDVLSNGQRLGVSQ